MKYSPLFSGIWKQGGIIHRNESDPTSMQHYRRIFSLENGPGPDIRISVINGRKRLLSVCVMHLRMLQLIIIFFLSHRMVSGIYRFSTDHPGDPRSSSSQMRLDPCQICQILTSCKNYDQNYRHLRYLAPLLSSQQYLRCRIPQKEFTKFIL